MLCYTINLHVFLALLTSLNGNCPGNVLQFCVVNTVIEDYVNIIILFSAAGPDSSDCSRCQHGKVLQNGICHVGNVTTCLPRFYWNSKTKVIAIKLVFIQQLYTGTSLGQI